MENNNQVFNFVYNDEYVGVNLDARNNSELGFLANQRDLSKALHDLMNCSENWHEFHLTIVRKVT